MHTIILLCSIIVCINTRALSDFVSCVRVLSLYVMSLPKVVSQAQSGARWWRYSWENSDSSVRDGSESLHAIDSRREVMGSWGRAL